MDCFGVQSVDRVVFYLSFTYFFSLTSFHFHYLSGVIPVECFGGWGKGEPGEARGGGGPARVAGGTGGEGPGRAGEGINK